MSEDQKVNLFIVGAAKSGTTTLYNHLVANGAVCMCSVKEPNYFSSEALKEDELYYKEKITTTRSEYNRLFTPGAHQKIIGEASVSYLFYPGTAKKIYDYNPLAKIVILLRNPVQRAFSHYLMDKKLGYTKQSFDEIIRGTEDPDRKSKYFQQVVNYGLYSKQVVEYYNAFPESQVLILLFEDLQESVSVVLSKIGEFLELKENFSPVEIEKYNDASLPKKGILLFLYRIRVLRKAVKVIFPEKRLQNIKTLFFNLPDERLSAEAGLWLKSFYKEDCKKLEKLINRKLTAWYE